MNNEIALFYLAIGCASELLLMKYPTPGERIGSLAAVGGGAFLLGLIIPPAANEVAMACLFVARFNSVAGKVLGTVIDAWRVRRARTGIYGASNGCGEKGQGA